MADYPAHGLPNWDDDLKQYIDAVPAEQMADSGSDLHDATTAVIVPIATARAVALSIALGG